MAAHQGPGVTGNTQSVTTTVASIVEPVNYHRTLAVQNVDSTNPIYIGGHTGVALTTSNGYRIAAGETFTVDLPPFAEVYAVSAEAGGVEIRFLEFDGRSGW